MDEVSWDLTDGKAAAAAEEKQEKLDWFLCMFREWQRDGTFKLKISSIIEDSR